MIPAEADAIQRILQAIPEYPVIVELGAYRGEDGAQFESMLRQGEADNLTHIMVEPDPLNQAAIIRNSRRPLGQHRRLLCGAVADTPGRRQFRFSHDTRDESRGSGSILEPSGHLHHFPTIKFHNSAEVECWTLNQIFLSERLSKIDLLWVDIQGAERQMIAGGKWALQRTHYCFMEAEDVEMYSGQALKPELITILHDLGWQLIQDFGYNILLRNEKYRCHFGKS